MCIDSGSAEEGEVDDEKKMDEDDLDLTEEVRIVKEKETEAKVTAEFLKGFHGVHIYNFWVF